MKVQIIVHPKAKKSRIEMNHETILHVHVHEPPVEGKANNAVINALARYYKVKKNAVVLISGEKSKRKVFEILSGK